MSLNPTLLGIAMDVSGTMNMSIRNNANADLSRIDALTKAYNFMIAATRLTAQKLTDQGEFPLRTFTYLYGLNISPGYVDLFTLLKNVQTVTERPEFQSFSQEKRRERYISAKKRDTAQTLKESGLTGLTGLQHAYVKKEKALENKPIEDIPDEAPEIVKEDILSFLHEQVGDTTLSLGELVDTWTEVGGSFNNGKDYLFGATPLRGCMSEIVLRFDRETKREKGLYRDKVLLVISDGDPTDGLPREFVERLDKAGVTIASAFITDRDVAGPRLLSNETKKSWMEGARILFDMASKTDRPSKEISVRGPKEMDITWRKAFEANGWTVPPGARLFALINQFEILADFMRMIATVLPTKTI